MKKLNRFLVLFLACLIAVPNSVYAVFKPGDEYKDGIQDFDREELFAQTGNLVYYDDIADYTEVGILSVLGVVSAYENQSFKPNVYMSKGEYIESVVKLFKIPYNTELQNYSQTFYDVPAEHPKAEYVYKALDAGLIYGYGNNTFLPDECISYDEAIAVLIRALGYEKVAISEGGYPRGYSKIASTIGLSKNLRVVSHEALTRIEAARLLYKTLFVNSASVTIQGNAPRITADGEQFLYKYYGLTKASGKVEANAVESFNPDIPASDNSVVIDGKRFYTDSPAYEEFLGYMTDYYCDEENNLKYMLQSRKTEEVIISAEDIIGFDFSTKTLEYCDNNRTRRAKLTSDYKLLYNGTVPEKTYDESIFEITDGTVKLISDDEGATYSVVSIEECKNYLIKSAALDNGKINIMFNFEVPRYEVDCNLTYIKLYDSAGAYLNIYKINESGEQKIDISPLKKNSVLSIYAPYGECDAQTGLPLPNVKYLKMAVSSETVKGKASSYDAANRTAIIDGVEYKIANSNYFASEGSEWNLQDNEFYLDAYGHLTALKSDTSSWKYGYIINVYYDETSDNENRPVEMRLLTSTGKRTRFAVSDSLKINEINVKKRNARQMLANSAQMINPSFERSQLIKYRTDDSDVITDIQTVTASIGTAGGYTSDQLNRYSDRKRYRIENDTRRRVLGADSWEGEFFEPKIIFKVPLAESTDDTKYSKVVISNSKGEITMEAYDVNQLVPQVMVYYSDSSSEEKSVTGFNSPCIVMLNKKNIGINEDGEPVLYFTVAQFGTVKEYTSQNLNLLDKYKQGQLFWLYEQDGYITKVEPIMVNGQIIGPDTLPSLNEDLTFSDRELNQFQECYSIVNDSEFIVQRGSYTGDGYKRAKQTTGAFMHAEWAGGGVLVYDYNDGKPIVRNGSISDLKPAESYGASASKIISYAHLGAATQYIIYNLD